MSEQKACCAHIVVRYMPRLNPSGSVTSEWKCSACGVPFVPAAEYDALRAVLDIEAKAREGREELLQENERLREALTLARELLSWWQGERGDDIHASVMEKCDAALAAVKTQETSHHE